MVKVKVAIITVIATLFALISIVAGITVYNIQNKNNQSNNQTIEAATLQGSGTASSPYLIKNQTDFQTFMDAVNSGTTYSGKHIRLENNISYKTTMYPIGTNSSDGFTEFQGTFDGNKKTISDLNITLPNFNGDSKHFYGTSNKIGYGLFAVLGANAQIHTLRLENIKITVLPVPEGSYSNTGQLVCVGAIAGLVQGSSTIYNCAIEGFSINGTDTIPQKGNGTYALPRFGGVVGAAWYQCDINNCYVSDFNVSFQWKGNYVSDLASVYDVLCAGIIGMRTTTSTIASNFYNGTVSTFSITDYNNNVYRIQKSEINGGISSGTGGNYSSSDDGKTALSSGYWYYHKSYNDGNPYLKDFMELTTYTVTASSGGSVSKNSFQVPTELAYLVTQSSNTILCDNELLVTATPNANYKFLSWDKSGTTFTATFVKITCNITINYDSNMANLSGSSTYSVEGGTRIETEYDSLDKYGAYTRITIKTGSTVIATLTAKEGYYISNGFSGTLTEDVTIIINTTSMTYDPDFQ